MTPKEKALSLCQKFGWLSTKWEQTGYNSLELENAKQCALIAVDEIIESMNCKNKDYLEKTYWHPIDYWEQVKKEIENI